MAEYSAAHIGKNALADLVYKGGTKVASGGQHKGNHRRADDSAIQQIRVLPAKPLVNEIGKPAPHCQQCTSHHQQCQRRSGALPHDQVEQRAHRLTRALFQHREHPRAERDGRRIAGDGQDARRRRGGVHPTLRSIGGMIRATEAVLGGAHCVPMALRDLQLDHWLDTAAEVAESAGAAGPAEAAEAALLDALRDGGGVSFESALAFFGAAWEALAAQWAWHLRCGLLMLHESVGERLRALLEWRLDRAFLAADAARAEAVRAMVAASVERATIEYGAASDDTTELLGLWERVQTGRGAE